MFKEDDYNIKVVDNNKFLDVGIIYWDGEEFKMGFDPVAGNASALLEAVDLLDWVDDSTDIIKRN